MLLVCLSCGSGAKSDAVRAECRLAPLEVLPALASPGDLLSVSSTGFVCAYELPEGSDALGVVLVPAGQEAIRLGEVPVEPDGSFMFEGEVPQGASAGEAWIVINPPTEMLPPCPSGTEPTDCPAAPVGVFEIAG